MIQDENRGSRRTLINGHNATVAHFFAFCFLPREDLPTQEFCTKFLSDFGLYEPMAWKASVSSGGA
jgi:hypothetical protein